jgi:predicted nucleotidyltransferase
MKFQAAYPTPEHEIAAEAITRFFTSNFNIDSILLVNSCARGKATRDSCLDMIVLVEPASLQAQLPALETGWERYLETDRTIENLKNAGKYSVVHLDFVDGAFAPQERDEAAGPDDFELGPGNFLAYSVPLWQGSDYLTRLKEKWLPYYNDELRAQRLDMVRAYCLNNLNHIPLYIERGLYFQSFDRLYNAYREFLQALFIARRTYPIAYNKWIREQVEEILGLPALYNQLTHLFEIGHFESTEILDKAKEVEELLDSYAPAPRLKP